MTCSIVYYKFDILYSTVLGFNVTVIKDEFIYVYYVSDTFMWLKIYYIFVYTPLWVILVSQNLTCSNVYYMFRVYCLMNYNFDVLHSSGALHCNINLWLVCLCIWCIIYIRIIQVAKYISAIFVHVYIITYVSYTSFL